MKKMVSRGDELYSRDVFQVLFEYEVSRCQRYPAPLALLQIEMSPTTLNEEAISSAGSVFASALNAHLRSVDIPSRNGNIFLVLLPTSDEHGARAVCERLLSVFKNKHESPNGVSFVFSLQIGATAIKGGTDISSEAILQKAEEALKQSRLKGQNTYVVA
jgi:diguanylate cyclase (GGDEF)-like protein